MKEVLSKTNDVTVSCEEMEYYHLRLSSGEIDGELLFWVSGYWERWDESRGRMVCSEELNVSYASLEEAKQGYIEHRAQIVSSGFIYSDMDMF